MAIVYRHRRVDTNQVFYIGIGKSEKRAYSKYNRNKWWSNIVNKIGYNVEILAEDITWEDACELEVFLIEEYGRKDINTGTLVNMTSGGDGTLGHVPSENARKLSSERHQGNTYRKDTAHSKETKGKISDTLKGRIISEEWRVKISNARKGKSLTIESRERLSRTRKEKGLKPTKEVLEKALEGRKRNSQIIKETTTGIEFRICDYLDFFDIHKTTLINNSFTNNAIRCGKHKGLNFIRIKKENNDIKSK